MDIQMPVMDGNEATLLIRKEEQLRGWKPIPIIGVSADVTKRSMKHSKSSGMNGFVAKPFNRYQLFEALNPLLPHQ